MATGSWPTLVDAASRTAPDGEITPYIAEMLSQSNEMHKDIPWEQSNEMTGHEFVFRTSIPGGFWRGYNQGTPYGKSTTAKGRVGMGMLTGYSQIDRALARHVSRGDPMKFRETEDVAFLEGMSQTIAGTMIYGNTAATPAEFYGLATFYNTTNTSTAANAANCISGGGAANANTSLFLVGWGPGRFFGLFPPGTTAGLIMEDKGDVRAAYDAFGNPFEAYTSYFEQQAGICPQDWRYGARLCNLDTTTAGLAGANAPDLFVLLDQILLLFPTLTAETSGVTESDAPDEPATGVRPTFYMNRTLRHWMNVQAMRNRNVLLTINDYDGRVVQGYRNFPFRTVDQIVNTESTVS